jgi:hypothetical protein
VPGQDVPELVPDDEPQFLLVVQVDQTGGDHKERPVPADRHGVYLRGLHDVALRHVRQVQDVRAVPHQRVDVRELALGHLHGAG